jgi:hypothetical protein
MRQHRGPSKAHCRGLQFGAFRRSARTRAGRVRTHANSVDMFSILASR